MDTASCRIGLTAFVTNEISPKKMLVPMLIRTETPTAPRYNMGSSQDSVDTRRIRMITGSRISVAVRVSLPVIFCAAATSTAWPDSAFWGPISSYMASVT